MLTCGKKSFVSLAALAVLLVAACSPAPVSVPAAPQPASIPAPTAPPAPAVSKEDAAWSRVVADAKKEGKVTFYSVTYVGADGQPVADAFYQRYGIRVDLIGGRGSSHFERLRTEKRMGQMVGDIVQSNTPHLLNMKETGYLERVAELPVLRDKSLWEVDPFANDPDGYVASYQAQWITPLINPRLVPKDREPKSLKDLLKPEWKGKILSMNPIVSTGAYNYYVPFISRGAIDWSYVENMGKQDLVWTQGTADTPRLVAKGDFPIAAFSWSGENARVLSEGAPLKAVSIEEGDPYTLSALGLVAGAPHMNAAKVFLNWIFSKEGAEVILQKTGYKIDSLVKGVSPGTPEPLIPPARKRVVLSKKDMDDAAKLYADQHITKLYKLK